MSRCRVLQFVGIASVACVTACSDGVRRDLVEEFATEIAIQGDEQPAITRTLQPGTYLVEVHERDIDLRLLVDAGGSHSEMADDIPRHGALAKVVSMSAAGELRVQVRSADHSSKRGTALLHIARWARGGPAPPGELELGFDAFAVAGEQAALGTTESRALAADKLHEAAAHFEAANDDAARAQAEYSLANLQFTHRNEYAAAIRAADAARDAYDEADDEVGIQNAATLRAAAELELASGMNASTQHAEQLALYESADARLRDATQFFTTHQLPVRAAYAVNMRGVRAHYLGDYEQAAKYLSQAVAMARTNADVGEQAKSLANLAWVHNRLGRIAQAADEYAALLPLVERERQPYQYAALLGNYGFCLIALGDFDRALALHNEALSLYTSNGNESERATELAALGGLYFRVGDAERALETLQAAIAAQERVADGAGQASSLRVAGNAAAALGRHELALEYLRRSARIDGNASGVARTRVLIAGALRTLGDLPGAEQELGKALESGNALARANALEERARLRGAQHNPTAAITDLRAADAAYVALGLEFNRIDTNTALSQLLLASHDIGGASAAADEAVAIVSRIRVKSANPEWRARFLSARYSPYEARIAADLAGAGGEAAAWRAFRTAEGVRARSLADELAFDAGGGPRGIDPAVDALRSKLTSQQMRLESRMQRQDADDAGTSALRQAILETRAQIDAKAVGVATHDTKLAESLQQMQDRLPPDTAVLAYFVGDTASHGWLLTRRELRHATLSGRVALQRSVEAVVAAQRQRGATSGAGREPAALLLGRLLDGLTETRMLVIPDGPLNGVPFAALALPGSATDLLVDRFVLGYSPSLSLALAPQRRPPAHGTRVAVISDPVYAADDRRLQLAGNGTGGNLRGAVPQSPNKLTRLPYSALEGRAVAKAFGEDETTQLAGFDATPGRVLALPRDELTVLHFATHALPRSDSPDQSALYLSEYAPDGSLLPNSRLTANDIKASGLRANVVVLSGCATGDGSELRGEGVLGLTYGFLANGSQSVVAALWPIEDASTARFMSEFYSAYRISGRAAEALRTAQLRTRGSTAATVWSSFVVRANEFP